MAGCITFERHLAGLPCYSPIRKPRMTTEPVSASAPETTARRGSLLTVFLTVFIDLLGFGMVIPLVAIYGKEIVGEGAGWKIALLGASHPVMQFFFSPLWGRVSDRVGRRPILLLGLLGSTVSYAVFGFATAAGSFLWILISRAAAGMFGATVPTAQAYIADTTTPETRTKGMALIGAAFGLGFTFGPLLAAAALAFSPGDELSPWPGYAAAGLSAFAFVFALFRLPESLHPGSAPAKGKLLDVRTLRAALTMPTVGVLLLTTLVANLSFSNFEAIVVFMMPQKVKDGGFGYDLVDVVLLFSLVGLVHAIAQGFVRRFSGRVSEARLATGGAIASLVGFVLLALSAQFRSPALLLSGMLIEAAGFAFIPAPVQSLISRRSDPGMQGGILGVAQSLGALARIGGHSFPYPLFFLAAPLPFWLGAALMLVTLALIAAGARGRDFASEPAANAV
jgi:MFS family permease